MPERVCIPGAPDQPDPPWAKEAKANVPDPDRPRPVGRANPMSMKLASCLLEGRHVLNGAFQGRRQQTVGEDPAPFDIAWQEFMASVMKKADYLGIRHADVEAAFTLISARSELLEVDPGLWEQVVTNTIRTAQVLAR